MFSPLHSPLERQPSMQLMSDTDVGAPTRSYAPPPLQLTAGGEGTISPGGEAVKSVKGTENQDPEQKGLEENQQLEGDPQLKGDQQLEGNQQLETESASSEPGLEEELLAQLESSGLLDEMGEVVAEEFMEFLSAQGDSSLDEEIPDLVPADAEDFEQIPDLVEDPDLAKDESSPLQLMPSRKSNSDLGKSKRKKKKKRERGFKKKYSKNLEDISEQLDVFDEDHSKIVERAVRGIRLIEKSGTKRSCKRNYLHITFGGGEKHYTVHLLSAGLGGKHPKFHGRSSSHTEQMVQGLMQNRSFQKRVKKKVGARSVSQIKTLSTYSSNQCCDHNHSMSEGCRSIPAEDFSFSGSTRHKLYYRDDYSTGSKNSTRSIANQDNAFRKSLGMKRRDSVEDLYGSDSEDEVINTNNFRGKDISKIKKFDS